MSLWDFAKDLADPGGLFHDSKSARSSKEQADKQYELEKTNADRNYNEQVRMNNFNIEQQEREFQYQQDLNAMQMEREDNAVQRRVNDLKMAGLSPTLAAGSSASATPVHAGNAPQGVAPQKATPSDIKVQEAMFRRQMQKEDMSLAMAALSNMADISRTKAETEFIKAQKNRMIAETPIDLRLKEQLQEFQSEMHPLLLSHEKLNIAIDDLKRDNQILSNAIAKNDVALKALDVIIKNAEANNADRKYKSEADRLENEVKEKSLAITLAEHVVDWENKNGVPISAMSPVAKTFWPLNTGMVKSINGEAPSRGQVVNDWLGNTKFGQAWDKALEVRDYVFNKVTDFFKPKKPLVPKRKR